MKYKCKSCGVEFSTDGYYNPECLCYLCKDKLYLKNRKERKKQFPDHITRAFGRVPNEDDDDE